VIYIHGLPIQMTGWSVVTDEIFYNYEGNHVMFPMLLAFLYQSQTQIQYWNTAFFTFSFVAFWEVIELLARLIFGSLLLFGPDNDVTEPIEDIVLLDMGNGIIGICIALLVLATLRPQFKPLKWWIRGLLFVVYGVVYSALSPYGLCSGDCTTLHFPYGNIGNYFIIGGFGYIMNRYVVDRSLAYAFIFNAFLLNSATLILFKSSAIMVYITSAFLLAVWTWFYFVTKEKRRRRVDFNILSTVE